MRRFLRFASSLLAAFSGSLILLGALSLRVASADIGTCGTVFYDEQLKAYFCNIYRDCLFWKTCTITDYESGAPCQCLW
jgi:hypothetical protein